MAENENENKNASIVFISSIFRDLVAVSDKFPRCSQCKTVFTACCRPGETIFGSEFRMGFGGKGANQCVMAARLGAATTIVAKVETPYKIILILDFVKVKICNECSCSLLLTSTAGGWRRAWCGLQGQPP